MRDHELNRLSIRTSSGYDSGSRHGRVSGTQSIRRPGSVCGGDVRALLREHEPRYEVMPKEHSNGLSRDGFKNPLSCFFDNTLHGKVSHSKMDCNSGHSDNDHIRVPEARKEAND
ncbi:hypothetical protein Tco_1297631 [Tanacetum coccineum]